MLSSHIVVTKHTPNEADNIPDFLVFACSLLRRKQMEFFF